MRLAHALILGFAAIGTSVASAEPVTFGYGDEAGALSEIVVRKMESYRVGSQTNTSTLSKIYNATVERNAPGERRARVSVKDLRMEAVTSENPAVRVSGETEVYLMGALKTVPVILSFNDKGQLSGVVDWEPTRQAVLKAVESRIAEMGQEKALHADATLTPDAMKKLDDQVAKGLVALITKADQPAFLDTFYEELAYFLVVAGERLEIGASIDRPMQARNPADGSLVTMSHVLKLRELDPDKSMAQFDLKLAGDGVALLKSTMIAKLRETKLGEDEISRHVAAMAMHWDTEGTLSVDVKTGRLQKARINSRIQAGDVEVLTTQEVDVTTIK